MFKTIDVKNNKFIYLPNSLYIFDYSEQLEESMGEIDLNTDNEIGTLYRIENESKKSINDYYSRKKYFTKLEGVQINLIYDCNMKCLYCFAGDGTHYKSGLMDSNIEEELIGFLQHNTNDGAIQIQFVGGEPLLNFNALKKIVDCSQNVFENRADFYTTINGTKLTDKVIDFFNKNDINFMVSIDSNEKEINDKLRPYKNRNESSYDKIINDINKYNIDYNYDTFHITITPYNTNISEIAEFLYNKGALHLHFDLVKSELPEFHLDGKDVEIIIDEYDKLYDIFLERLNKNPEISCHPFTTHIGKLHSRVPILEKCGAGINLCAIDPKGDIYPCDMLMWDKYCLGDIENGIQYNIDFNSLVEDKLTSNCSGCWAKLICGGLCLAEKLLYMDQMYYHCKIKKHIVKLKILLYSEVLKKGIDFNFDKYM